VHEALGRQRRVAAALFFTLFGSYAYFFQGGGWNQNSRLAQLRALVEGRRLAINDYLVYSRPGGRRLARESIAPGTPWEQVADRASSADVALAPATGLIFPNKPPGTLLVGAPFYLAIFSVERALGADPDRWWVLTLNSHLVTLFSVGLAGALTAVVLLRASRGLFPQITLTAHAAAALTCGLGTLMLPFSTVLFDHALTAFWSLLAFALLVRDPQGQPRRALLAGLAAGMAVMTNYLGVLAAGLLFLYLLVQRRGTDGRRFVAGLAPPLLLLALYQAVCFGSALAPVNLYEYRAFTSEGRLLGILSWPDPAVLASLLFAPQRGLLVLSPVLALAGWGLVLTWRGGRRAEAALAAGVFLLFWLFNGSFNAWQGGWSIGTRYLVPALPFLSLGLTQAFARLPRVTAALAAPSVIVLLLATAVDVQPPRRARNPVRDYLWPLWCGRVVSVYPQVELTGPVSVNPVGVYEGGYYRLFRPGSAVGRWNSYNLGELLWPESRLSLLPLGIWLASGVALTLAWSRRSGA
jgi:hypothetical protein